MAMRLTPKEPGRVRLKLAELIRAEGIWIEASDLHRVEGRWTTIDVMRWNGDNAIIPESIETTIGSWDTMSECVRNGIIVETDTTKTMSSGVEIFAKDLKDPQP